jgi:hypothetical protein
MYGALVAATVRGVPSAALMPTVYLADRLVGSKVAAQPHWAQVRTTINDARRRFGLSDVASVTDQILDADRVLVLTSRASGQRRRADLRRLDGDTTIGRLLSM